MRPLPTSSDPLPPAKPSRDVAKPATSMLELGSTQPSTNQRRLSCPTQRAYPWLLITSTALAAVFCALYISKPVIVTEGAPIKASPAPILAANRATQPAPAGIAPSSDALPGDHSSRPRAAEPQHLKSAGDSSAFEETNLRIQHVLGAQGPDGEDLGRIVMEVPVLYQSRHLRWSQDDVTRARSLLTQIGNYQERSRALRTEAVELLGQWDDLVGGSIPVDTLRADSPSLPENQGAGAAYGAPLDTTQTIEIEN